MIGNSRISKETMNQTERQVIEWSMSRGIYDHSNAQAQTLKAVSEMGELADAVIKDDQHGVADAIGDVMVCLTNVAHMRGLTLGECFAMAYDAIKDRKGRMVQGGAFVKDEP